MEGTAQGKGGQNCKVCEDGFLVLKKFRWLLLVIVVGLVTEFVKVEHSNLPVVGKEVFKRLTVKWRGEFDWEDWQAKSLLGRCFRSAHSMI